MSQPWPSDPRSSASELFEMIETAERDPKAFGPEIRAALQDNRYGRHAAAQLAASSQTKPCRRR